MEAFAIYLLKVGAGLAIFLAIYIVFLQNTTFFKFNRIFLLLGFIISLILPFVKYTYDVVVRIPLMDVEMPLAYTTEVSADTAMFDWWRIFMIIYVAGVGIMLVKNILSYLSLFSMIKKGVKVKHRRFSIIENSSVRSPFSFLHYILMNTKGLSEIEKEVIIKHETTHIDQKHWIDLLCSECMLMLQWFNLFAWVYVRLLKENHEFLADKAVLDSGIKPAIYQAVLINQEFKGPIFSFANSFSKSKPLKRLIMIKKEKSASWKRLAALLIIPVFGAYIWASSEPRYIVEYTDYTNVAYSDVHNDSIYGSITQVKKSPEGETVSLKTSDKSIIIVRDTVKPKITKADPAIKSVSQFWIRESNPDGKPALLYVDGEKVKDLNNLNVEDIESLSILNASATAIYGEEGKNGVVLVTTKKKGNESSNKTSSSNLVLNHIIKESPAIPTIKLDTDSTKQKSEFWIRGISTFGGSSNALVLIDGKEGKLEDIAVEDIESFSILKDASALKIYGEKGKNGAILVTTKSATKE